MHSASVKPGIYRHYKGKLYEVTGTARHSETLEEMVVYKALGQPGENLWVRPLKMFAENVLADEKEVPRFEYLQPNTINEPSANSQD
jgi:hypothetical protein